MPLAKRWAFLAVLLSVGLAACDGDPADPDDDDDDDHEETGYAFIYTPPAGAPAITAMELRGTMNAWAAPGTAFTQQANGSWRVIVELDSATTYLYKFFINGEWVGNMCDDATWGHPTTGIVHTDSDGCVDDGFGGGNATLTLGEITLGFSHSPTDPAHLSSAAGRISVRFRARQDRVTAARIVVGDDTTAMHLQLRVGLEDVWRASLPAATAQYRILVDEGAEHSTFGPYNVPAELFTSVAWVADAVGYQIFPERFWNGDPSNDSLALVDDEYVYNEPWNNGSGAGPSLASSWSAAPNSQHCCHQYYGGDLQGILDRLSHLTELGVTVIYLNPIWKSGSAHGYDANDYTMVDPAYGDSALLRSFVDQVHAAGLKIIWDFVPNHTGLGFWAFQHAVTNGNASPYWNWYNFHPSSDGLQSGDGRDYDGWWGIGSLPELQTEVPAVRAHLLQVTRDWTEYGFDGIRVDVPADIDDRYSFFPAFRDAAKTANPDVYLVGEIWERDPSWLQGDQFDALMNYALGQGIVMRYALGQINGPTASNDMALQYADYPEASVAMAFNLISSHDSNRLLSFMGGGDLGATPSALALSRQRLASALLFAAPGMPVTYYGDECAFLGLNSGSIHTGRRAFQWGTCDVAMLAHYTQLSGLKKDVDALGSPVFRSYTTAGSVLAFYRGEPGPGEVLAAFNNANAGATLTLPAGTWVDAVTGASLTGSAPLDAYGWRYLERAP